ncbi:hypothetical protein AAFF_G00335250 [Aldrovandia affinis]|uniref:Protein Flattop n=1 Tax=Aldrovandia affinis TaxID=143900 RepID=A0AAD7SMD6_9TELE|nr:hypothetical protein AAFF_G00335250 [Aldrovandia affinis]
MASNFSANQYENAFRSHKLQNWTIPKTFKERPMAAEGHTMFIATDRGHLLPGVKRGTQGTFVGTWDLPRRICHSYINPTARSMEGEERLKCWSEGQGRNKRWSLKKSPEVQKSPENVDTPTNPPEGDGVCEASPQPETSPTSPRPASANQAEENQLPASDKPTPA